MNPSDSPPRQTIMPAETPMTVEQELQMVMWHLDRFDRLRASTASRASVTLSAAAILSAGNAVALSQLFTSFRFAASFPLLVFLSVTGAASAALVVIAMLRATGVLVTLKPSREWLPKHDHVPSGSPFNGHDVIIEHPTFESFRLKAFGRPIEATIRSAQAELWICIQQHRHRYSRLRSAVLLLRLAAFAFMIDLVSLVFANLFL